MEGALSVGLAAIVETATRMVVAARANKEFLSMRTDVSP
jgi:hypothetical protein